MLDCHAVYRQVVDYMNLNEDLFCEDNFEKFKLFYERKCRENVLHSEEDYDDLWNFHLVAQAILLGCYDFFDDDDSDDEDNSDDEEFNNEEYSDDDNNFAIMDDI